MSDQEQQLQAPAAAEEQQQQQEQEQQTNNNTTEETKPTGPQKPSQEQRLFQARALGNLVQQTVISNLPASQRPIPEWKRKALEKEAIARGETIAATENDGMRPDVNAGDGAYRPPHQRLAPVPLVSQQAQERSAFPGDFWFHKEIENLISKNRTKVQAGANGGSEEDAFWDRSGKAGRGVIASYRVDAWPLIRNAVRGRRGYFDENDDLNTAAAAEGTNDFGRITQQDNNNAGNQQQQHLGQQELDDDRRLGNVPVPTLYSDDDEDEN